jgi:hypothetical protein
VINGEFQWKSQEEEKVCKISQLPLLGRKVKAQESKVIVSPKALPSSFPLVAVACDGFEHWLSIGPIKGWISVMPLCLVAVPVIAGGVYRFIVSDM